MVLNKNLFGFMNLEKITLYSHNFEKQLSFYKDVLQFSVSNITKDSFDIHTKKTILTYKKSDNPNNFYHFAFLIYDDHFKDALDYVKNKNIPLILDKYTNEEIIAWQVGGESFYFYDEDQNIVT